MNYLERTINGKMIELDGYVIEGLTLMVWTTLPLCQIFSSFIGGGWITQFEQCC